MIGALVRFCRLLPARLELEYMRWAAREVRPTHPDVPYIAHRVAYLEEKCRA